jgi:hypothetical protein
MMELTLHSRDRSIECLNWTNRDCRLWNPVPVGYYTGENIMIFHYLTFFDLRLPITPLISSNFLFKLFGFPVLLLWVYLMTMIPETRHAH